MRYTVVLLVDPGEGGYTSLVPALPGCVSEGDTVDEALAMIRDAATGYLAAAVERGEEVTEEIPGTVVVTLDVPAPVVEAIA